jgi:hypothetical protein
MAGVENWPLWKRQLRVITLKITLDTLALVKHTIILIA